MRKIDKGAEPAALTRARTQVPRRHYTDLEHAERVAIRQACTAEQMHLCAYCCAYVSGDREDTMNEHLMCRDQHPGRSLDFDNIVASCKTPRQCDAAKGNKPIALTPLMAECENELVFLVSGRVEGRTPRAVETITTLNLGDHERNNKKLVEKRKVLSQALLQREGPLSPLDDDELLQMVIDDLTTPVNGKLEPYAPVVVSILKGWLSVAQP